MTQTIVGYGRVSRGAQQSDRPEQKRRLVDAFPGHQVDFVVDVCGGDVPLQHRDFFPRRLIRARDHGGELWMCHPDRLHKTLDDQVIKSNWKFIRKSHVHLRYLDDNSHYHSRIERILSGSLSEHKQLTQLVRLLDQHTAHRRRLLTVRGAKLGKLRPYSDIQASLYHDAFLDIAERIQLLARVPEGRRHFTLDAYLGAAYNLRFIKHGANRGLHRRVGHGQPGILTQPKDYKVAEAIVTLERLLGYTNDGRPRPLSNEQIAWRLNRMGLRNRHGGRFTGNTVFKWRSHPAFATFRKTFLAQVTHA